jgi:hypothetical protein
MLDDDALAEIEGDALAMFAQARLEPDRSPSMDLLSLRLIGSKPRRVIMGREADLHPGLAGRYVLRVHRCAPPDRARWLVGHELAEWWYRDRFFPGGHVEREAWCDALGAALVAPRPAFLSAMRALEHRVHRLAEAFDVPRALALLRIGEVDRRAVIYVRPSGPIARGAAFGWPIGPGLVRAVGRPPPGVHPVRLDGHRMGLMAAARLEEGA